MNSQIRSLAVASLVLVIALIVGTTYWQAWAAPSLADRRDNAIKVVAQFTIKRGGDLRRRPLRARAEPPAESAAARPSTSGAIRGRELFAHAVGYSTQSRSRSGIEQSRNDYLTGANANLSTLLDTTLDRLRGSTIEGNDLILTLRPRAQRVAMDALGGQCGAAVALEPKTGKVLVMASSPTLQPESHRTQLLADPARPGPLRRRSAAQPRHERSLHAGLDLQGRHGGGRAGHRHLYAGVDVLRPRLLHRVRAAGQQLRHLERRSGPSPSPRRWSTRSTRRSARWGRSSGRRGDPRLRAPLRLLRGPPGRSTFGRAGTERPLPGRQAAAPIAGVATPIPGASRSGRSGCS